MSSTVADALLAFVALYPVLTAALWMAGGTEDRVAVGAVKEAVAGFAAGLRRRRPVRPVVSAAYRHNFHPFVAPWRFMRTPQDRLRARREDEIAERRRHATASRASMTSARSSTPPARRRCSCDDALSDS